MRFLSVWLLFGFVQIRFLRFFYQGLAKFDSLIAVKGQAIDQFGGTQYDRSGFRSDAYADGKIALILFA